MSNIKIKKGGIDSIVAFIVILLPLVYVLIYMVAILYHFSVQMYLNQVVKETLVMASTYGDCTSTMESYLINKVSNVIDGNVEIKYYVREFYQDGDISGLKEAARSGNSIKYLSTDSSDSSRNNMMVPVKKADLLGIQVVSEELSLLATVGNFNIFGSMDEGDNELKYSSYREEIIRNDSK